MKSLFKKILILIGVLIFLVLGYGWLNYAPDKSLDELKKSWGYDNSQFIDVQGMPVHYRINGTGEPLVLIHGTGASLHTWETWTNILEKDYQIISLDLPAFGLTGPNPKRTYTLDFYAKFLDEFLSKKGISNCAMAGNSLGGAIVWKYAAHYPEKVKSLILIDPSGYPRNKELPFVFRIAKNKMAQKFLSTVTPKSLFKKSLKEVFVNDELVTEEMINRYYELYLREGNREAFLDRVNAMIEPDPSDISTIKTPTLIMWGEKDEWIPVEDAYKFQKDIKDSEVVIYENVGHLPMEEKPLQSAKDARSFLIKNMKSEVLPELSILEQ